MELLSFDNLRTLMMSYHFLLDELLFTITGNLLAWKQSEVLADYFFFIQNLFLVLRAAVVGELVTQNDFSFDAKLSQPLGTRIESKLNRHRERLELCCTIFELSKTRESGAREKPRIELFVVIFLAFVASCYSSRHVFQHFMQFCFRESGFS